MPSADRLYEFVRIFDAGSITAAAATLKLPRSTLSRRMTALEQELGVRLMHRQTRRLVLTDAGRKLLDRARRVTVDLDALWSSVQQLDDSPRGLLRVSVPAGTDPALFIRYMADFEEVRLEVRTTSRHEDLVGENVHVAIRFGRVTDPKVIARRVATARTVAVAQPDYLGRAGTPATAGELEAHGCVVMFADGWNPVQRWPLRSGGSVRVGCKLAANDFSLIRAAVLEGHGIGLLPERLVRDDCEAGRMVRVLETEVGSELPVSVVFADREFIDPKVRVFVDRAVVALQATFAPG